MKIIGIHGKARAGKDTLANFFVHNHGYAKYSFALPLKQAANLIFDWDERHSDGHLKEIVDEDFGVSPRFVYQTLGTEWGRKTICDDLWLRVADKHIKKYDAVVIPDVRFDNEAEFILKRNGILVHIIRDDQPQITSNNHISESGLSSAYVNSMIVVPNIGGSLDSLERAAAYINTMQP